MSGEELKEIRLILKLTQTELAEKIGVKLRALQYWEKNERQIPETTVYFVNDLIKNAQSAYNISKDSILEERIKTAKETLNKVNNLIQGIKLNTDVKSLEEIDRLYALKFKIMEDLQKYEG